MNKEENKYLDQEIKMFFHNQCIIDTERQIKKETIKFITKFIISYFERKNNNKNTNKEILYNSIEELYNNKQNFCFKSMKYTFNKIGGIISMKSGQCLSKENEKALLEDIREWDKKWDKINKI